MGKIHGLTVSLLNQRVPLAEFHTAFERNPDDIKVTVVLD